VQVGIPILHRLILVRVLVRSIRAAIRFPILVRNRRAVLGLCWVGSMVVSARRGVCVRVVVVTLLVLVRLSVVVWVLVVRLANSALGVRAMSRPRGEVVLGNTRDVVRVVELGRVLLSLSVNRRVRRAAVQRLLEAAGVSGVLAGRGLAQRLRKLFEWVVRR
jgi:hypothetical protein